jgi:cell division septation protein DedD
MFFILLLANVGVFGYFALTPSAEVSASKAHAALRPEAIRLPGDKATGGEKVATAAAKGICLEWSGLSEANLAKAREALEAMDIKDRLVLPSSTDYWVHIPPLKNAQDAEKKLAELKGLGVDDGKIVEEEGKWRYAIALAAFASRQEAEFYLKQLRDKNIKSAKLIERQPPSTSLMLVDVDDALQAKLEQLQKDFDKSELKPVECRVR